MDQHYNPSRNKVSFPLFTYGAHQSTPRTNTSHHRFSTPSYKKSNSFKHVHQITRTPSPHELAQNFRERDGLQEEIMKMLEENSRMIGMLADFDYSIKRKTEEIQNLRALYQQTKQQKYYEENIEELESEITFKRIDEKPKSPIYKELMKIKSKLDAIDLRESLSPSRNNSEIRIQDD